MRIASIKTAAKLPPPPSEPFEPLVPLCYDGGILFKGDENVNIKLVLLGLLALFSLYRLYEHNDFMTLCATVIVVAAFVLSALHLWRRRE